jgi:hypothetical protein
MLDGNPDLSSLAVGDIFHATSPNSASLICLVLSVTPKTIEARRITTQESLSFDRQSGMEKTGPEQALAIIDSVAPLPSEIYNVFLDLDRKYGALMAMDEESRFQDLEQFKLTDAEKKALIFIASHYPANPLPPVE